MWSLLIYWVFDADRRFMKIKNSVLVSFLVQKPNNITHLGFRV